MTEEMKKMTFDEAYSALEKTVAAMEMPDISFEDSLKHYERACELVACCRMKLDDAKLRMTDISERVKKLTSTSAAIPDVLEG